MDDEATQQSTQNQFDPRRLGHNGSGLRDSDISDVICILHPASPAAFRIVNHTAKSNAQHILQNHTAGIIGAGNGFDVVNESETILLESFHDNRPLDLALRFSSSVFDPAVGFCFGRNIMKCDINLDSENKQKRVSNTHFRIFLNSQGILMLEDLSTNGTIVDHNILGGKRKAGNEMVAKGPKNRTLDSGSIIEILSDTPEVNIKFLLRIPPREGFEREYIAKFQAYMTHKAVADQRAITAKQGPHIPEGAVRGMLAAPLAGPPNPKVLPTSMPAPTFGSDYGMHWSGGGKYKCTGILGKGAFATVYQLATRLHGELFAAKELEKKRFMKNGVLDQRLDNEMQIMKELNHENIVKYIDYVETEQYLYIIMEYVPCGDLQGYTQAHGTLPEHMGRAMTTQILDSLAYLHKRQITHRDIKPDNILICSEDPFVVKLTDFGLSKVVKNNETFLKTFCGTLLYCAPEVFPHYDNYVAGKRPKRRRRDDSAQSSHHWYSQSVDIWSYAAVLWFVLCGKPPFEGVMDGNGKGMFNRIMETPLDTTHLEEHNISKQCIDLLTRMLNTDPATRPNERACLRHPWLNHDTTQIEEEGNANGLPSIEEDDEELDASQLSIHDNSAEPEDKPDPDSQASNESTNARDIKRQKGESFYAPREQADDPSSSDASMQSIPLVNDVVGNFPQPPRPTNNQRLFGEISQTALKSSGLLGANTNIEAESTEASTDDASYRTQPNGESTEPDQSAGSESASKRFIPPIPQRANASWRESMVRELNMSSPESFNSTGRDAEPPKTPGEQAASGSQETPKDNAKQPQDGSQEVTPKPKQSSFNRQISIPISASFFYDPFDPATHNPEYASRASGMNFLDESSSNVALNSLPETVVTSFHSTSNESKTNEQSPNKENEPMIGQAQSAPNLGAPFGATNNDESSVSAAALSAGEFLKPPRILGKLTSTDNSFTHVTLNLTQRVSTWGRNPSNTFVYRDGQDTRIPKVALEIYFHAKGLSDLDMNQDSSQSISDWTQMDSLNVFVGTQSKRGITVNGRPLTEKDEHGRKCFGRLYTGDEICVSQINEERLKFTCEFFVGKGVKRRREGSPRFIVEAADLASGE